MAELKVINLKDLKTDLNQSACGMALALHYADASQALLIAKNPHRELVLENNEHDDEHWRDSMARLYLVIFERASNVEGISDESRVAFLLEVVKSYRNRILTMATITERDNVITKTWKSISSLKDLGIKEVFTKMFFKRVPAYIKDRMRSDYAEEISHLLYDMAQLTRTGQMDMMKHYIMAILIAKTAKAFGELDDEQTHIPDQVFKELISLERLYQDMDINDSTFAWKLFAITFLSGGEMSPATSNALYEHVLDSMLKQVVDSAIFPIWNKEYPDMIPRDVADIKLNVLLNPEAVCCIAFAQASALIKMGRTEEAEGILETILEQHHEGKWRQNGGGWAMDAITVLLNSISR